MKKVVKVIVTAVLTLCCFLGVACNIRLPSGCNSKNTGQTVQPILIEDNSKTEFTMTMVEKRSFYYPTIEGRVKLDFYPTKFEVIVDGKGSFDISESDYTNLYYSDGNYIVSFTKIHIFGSLKKGEYRVTVKAFDKDKPYLVDYETFLSVDELYTALSGFDYATGEIFYAMDKESNWIGPYKIVQPIKSGGAFVAEGYDFGGSWN